MALVLAAFALLSLYSNYQKAHISEIEKVTIKPAPPLPAPSPSISPEAPEP